mmetsp:Transcript_21991/g.25426  ORF Transcript_21991/g.25426 Transcript_21991/m.25426 type:complete len:342 (+) Transcript_21991:97-1122(+)
MVCKKQDTSSNASFILTTLAFLSWNGSFLLIVAFNLCLLFGNSFITITPLIGTRIFAMSLYLGIIILLPCGGLKSHLKDGAPMRSFSETYYFPSNILRSFLKFSFVELPRALVQAEAKPEAQFIIAGFPHGCGSEFRILMEGYIQKVLPNIVKENNLRTLAASILFKIPLVREVALWTGCIDANRKTAEMALNKGRTLLVLPGGEAEQILTTYGKEKVYLKKRKGFIKLAMRNQISVVPMYVFGSSDLFYTSTFLFGPRHWLMKNMGICIPFCFGLLGSLCPLPKKITVAFGAPMKCTIKGTEPTSDKLDCAHQQFCKELKELFDKHKESLGYGNRELEIL